MVSFKKGKCEFLGGLLCIRSSASDRSPHGRSGQKVSDFLKTLTCVHFYKFGETGIQDDLPHQRLNHLSKLSSSEFEVFTDGRCLASIDKELNWVLYDVKLWDKSALEMASFRERVLFLNSKKTRSKSSAFVPVVLTYCPAV